MQAVVRDGNRTLSSLKDLDADDRQEVRDDVEQIIADLDALDAKADAAAEFEIGDAVSVTHEGEEYVGEVTEVDDIWVLVETTPGDADLPLYWQADQVTRE